MLPSIPTLQDYNVSPVYGFIPDELPLERLPDPYYAIWERVIGSLQSLVLSRRLRSVVDRMPVLSTIHLRTDVELRRAYVVLSFLTNAYIWGGDSPAEVVPPSISRPYLECCRELELPSITTYASTVLWNIKPIDLNETIDSPDNMATLYTFTGSMDESWFYIVSAAIEARSGPAIPIMLDAIQAARDGYSAGVRSCLETVAERLDELCTLLERMYEHCDPYVFYNIIRPFLAGSKNMEEAGLPRGVMFDESGTRQHEYVTLGGGSAAQSSVIQFFDIVLGVSHHPTGQSGKESPALGPRKANFIHEMREYMPGLHRRFLERIEQVANIQQYVESHREDGGLAIAYDACLAMLRELRDRHIRMVSRYIVVRSHEAQRRQVKETFDRHRPLNLANTTQQRGDDVKSRKDLRGTGGTALIPFLKQARDETGEPAIGTWARRIMSNGPAVTPAGATRAKASNGSWPPALGDAAQLVAVGESDTTSQQAPRIIGLSGYWTLDDSEGGICHW